MENRGARKGLVLLVDDDPSLCNLVERWLQRDGYGVEIFPDGEACLAGLASSLPDCICLDLHLPGLSGLETLHRIKTRHPLLPVIVLTAETSVETVVATMQAGAYEYLVKPLDRPKLLTILKHAVERHRLGLRVTQLEREVEGRGYANLLGASEPMKTLFRQMDRVAATDISVLAHGESGTGKELVARAIHENSSRRDGPFVAVNCAAIPENLEESELFGHEKGSFTGAAQRRVGRCEQAHLGTLFLDEVAELSLALQAKLLRVLQERRFQRIGGLAEISSDFRLLAATHRNLETEVKAGRFREDLFFRIVVFELNVPALRERGQDIDRLASHFLKSASHKTGKPVLRLSRDTLAVLLAYPWPGNVRELKNAMESAQVVARGDEIHPQDLPDRVLTGARKAGVAVTEVLPEPEALATTIAPRRQNGHSAVLAPPLQPEPAAPDAEIKTLDQLEREAIEAALARTGGNLSAVVRELGIGRTTLYRKLKSYGLRT